MVGQMLCDVVVQPAFAGHQQGGTGGDHHPQGNAVDRAQQLDRHVQLLGHLFGFHGAGGLPSGPGGQRPFVMGLQIALEGGGIVPRQQNLGRACGQDHGPVHGGVERLEVLQVHTREFDGDRHIDVPVDGHAFEIRVVLNQGQLGVEGLGLGHDVFHRLQLRHVIPRLVGHVQVAVGQRFAQGFVAGQCPAHTAFPPVVGGQGQMPITKHAVEFLQVIQGRAGRFQHVAPVISEQVLLQIEILARGGHELPHAGRLGAGNRLRIEGRLDEGQQSQFGGHFSAF